MLKPRKKITKKQLKEDKLVTYVFKINNYLEHEWKRLLFIAASAVVVFLVGYLIYQSGLENERQAAHELFPLESRYAAGVYDSTLVSGLEAFLTRYDNTESGGIATFYLANTYYSLGDFLEAEKYFRQYLDNHDGADFMSASAHAGIAACFEQRKMYKDAAEYYQSAIEKYSDVFLMPELMIGAARSLFQIGQIEEARTQCQNILTHYPDSQQAVSAEVLLAKM